MSLTANFDFCVQLGIAETRAIFHEAFKNEGRYPHNISATRTMSGRQVQFEVKVHDDESRPADLEFLDPKHLRFFFPFDLTVSIPSAPDPTLSRFTMRARVAVPALLATWPEDGEDVLGPDFREITPGDVQILELSGLPTITADNFARAIHSTYLTIPHVYPQGGNTLVLYDGARDLTLSPPNAATPSEIQAALETHGGLEYLKVTAPIHVNVPLASGGAYSSYGRIIFWRLVQRATGSITVTMSAEPADPALATRVELDTPSVDAGTELAAISAAIHSRYDSVPHVHSLSGNTLTVYDDARDVTLAPPNAATPYEITATIVFDSGVEYLRVVVPIHVNVPSTPIGLYTSYGRLIFYRAITRTATTISVNMASEPAAASLATKVELDSGLAALKNAVAAALQPLAVTALGGFGTVSAASAGSVPDALRPLAISAINGFGVISEPYYEEADARAQLQFEIAEYLRPRRYPFYTPRSGDPDEPLTTPVGCLLPADGVLAVLMNRRTGNPDGSDDELPDNFLGGGQLALGVGRAKVDENIAEAIDARYPNVRHGGTDEVSVPEGSATLKALNVELADPGEHDEAEGHLWVTGEAEVHIDCWPDPDVSFSGPVYVRGTPGTDAEGNCTFDISAEAGEFDIGQSCCDVLIDLLIPIVGIVMLIIIESTIDRVGGDLAEQVAGEQGRKLEPIPPVVADIAEITACLTGLRVSRQGFVFPGTVTIRRYGRSFDDLGSGRDLPRP